MSARGKIYEVKLELLRHGPPHNQLLSKITNYLGLCGNLGAETIRLPFDHGEYLSRLAILSYCAGGEDQVRSQLEEMGTRMAELFEALPGLTPLLARAHSASAEMTHLQLVLTPQELALLPFECAYVPKGAPGGAGQRLLLQTKGPVTITRSVRGISGHSVEWPATPHILFAYASPGGVGSVPYEQHLLALRRALSPWIGTPANAGGDEDKRARVRAVSKHLTVLQNASVEDIYRACSEGRYTHVHVLAHGIPTGGRADLRRVGLGLHDRRDPRKIDVVDGARFANALRFRTDDPDEPVLPVMVTVASCDSGKVESVVSQDASVAHQLHLAGVPVVIVSQFPLSKEGSVVMTEELYRRVLRAEDVRTALHHVRRRLFSLFADRHDWASLVVYAALPPDFESQLATNRSAIARQEIDSLFADADRVVMKAFTAGVEAEVASTAEADVASANGADGAEVAAGLDRELRAILERLDALSREQLERGAADDPESVANVGSTQKRKAEVLWWMHRVTPGGHTVYKRDSLEELERSWRSYGDAVRRHISQHWALVQYLALTRVLQVARRIAAKFPTDLWTVAKVAAELDVERGNEKERAWAYGSLAELHLMQVTRLDGKERDDAKAEVMRCIAKLVQVVGRGSEVAASTRRQFARYDAWWARELRPSDPDAKGGLDTQGVAQRVVEELGR